MCQQITDIKKNPDKAKGYQVGNGESRPEPKVKDAILDYIQNGEIYMGWS